MRKGEGILGWCVVAAARALLSRWSGSDACLRVLGGPLDERIVSDSRRALAIHGVWQLLAAILLLYMGGRCNY